MFTEGSVYDPPRDDDGVRCLVMRQWPRGIVHERIDVWLKELGPATAQLRALKEGSLLWPSFALAYLERLRSDPATHEALAQVRALEENSGKVTLLCWEREPPCHRFLLLDFLNGKAP